jgi:hypothetical protein
MQHFVGQVGGEYKNRVRTETGEDGTEICVIIKIRLL